jgi:hypothetical protein
MVLGSVFIAEGAEFVEKRVFKVLRTVSAVSACSA